LKTLQYRILLRDRAGDIVGRVDYESEDDVTALTKIESAGP
jgi:hypothetical protein